MKRILVVAFCLVAAGCAHGSGRVSGAVDRAQETRMGGEFVIEMTEGGSIVGTAAEIPLADVPAACLAGADRAFPGGGAVSASKMRVGGRTYFMVVKRSGPRRVELFMNPDGTLAGKELPMSPAEWPAPIVAAAVKAAPGGEVVAVEQVSGPEAAAGEQFHVKILVDGEQLRVSVTADGKVVKIVRKMRAEIRVPR